MTVRVAGSLWSVAPGDQADTLHRAAQAGLRTVHWDRTDGVFAAPGGFDADRAAELTAHVGGQLDGQVGDLVAEAHLMVTDPLAELDAWTGFCELVVVHAEARDVPAALRRIERRGARPGLAFSPGTPTGEHASSELAVLTMSIVPGQAGSTFDPAAFDRLRDLRGTSPAGRLLGVDGGVTADHGAAAIEAGADWLVSGTALFGADDPGAWLTAVGAPAADRAR